jgi:hypothetical protein
MAYDTSGGTNVWLGGPSQIGTNTSSSVNTSTNDTLRIRASGGDAYTVIAVTSGASTAKTTIRNDLNAAFSSNSLPFSARIIGTNQLQIAASGGVSGNVVDIDSVANGSTLNTAVGYANGGDSVSINEGFDAKGTLANGAGFGPIWGADGGNLVVHPRDNGAGGSFNTNFQGHATISAAGNSCRFQMIADDDYVVTASDTGDTGDYNHITYVGPYTPGPGVSVTGAPLVMLQQPGSFVTVSDVGILGGASDRAGGVATALGTTESRIYRATFETLNNDPLYQPNAQRSTPTFDTQHISIHIRDSQGAGTYGLLGFIDLVRVIYRVPSNTVNSTFSKVFFGDSSINTTKWIIDWDGATTPGIGSTSVGIQFP